MTTCLRCHRPMKYPTVSGFGPVCVKRVQPVKAIERDLFGYDIEAAALSAQVRLMEFIGGRAALSRHAIREAFQDARQRLGAVE